MLRYLALALFICIICLQSCGPADGVWKNDQIPPSARKKLHQMNEGVFADLKQNKQLHLEYILSYELINHPHIKHDAELLGHELRTKDYQLFDEYYLVRKPDVISKIENRDRGVNSYNLYSYAITHEMYTVMLLPRTGADRKMITLSYCKFDYGWKLHRLDIRPYMFNGRTAFHLFEIAKQQIAKGYINDTQITMEMAASCLRPSREIRYPFDSVFVSTYSKFTKKADSVQKFPMPLNNVSTKPQILGIYTKEMPDGYYPMIGYLSKIKLSDTMALKAENREIMKTIGNTLPGIDKDKTMLFHRIYNKVSTKDSMQAYFDIRTDL